MLSLLSYVVQSDGTVPKAEKTQISAGSLMIHAREHCGDIRGNGCFLSGSCQVPYLEAMLGTDRHPKLRVDGIPRGNVSFSGVVFPQAEPLNDASLFRESVSLESSYNPENAFGG